jgi:hypothetical protein
MNLWKPITGSEIIDSCIEDNNVKPLESVVEDAYKQNWLLASDGELKLLKLYYTDGFGWYFNKKTKQLTFVLHECKVLGAGAEFKAVKIKTYLTCIKKALLQAIGYYNKIKNKSYKSFSKELKKLAKDFNYDDVNQFIIDNFGLFLITCPNFVGHVKFSDVKDLVKSLEEPMNNSEVSPSKYWSSDKELKAIMERWNPGDVALIPTEQYDTTDTQKILEEIVFVNGNNN